MMNRIILNITASANWRRRPVGIIRVEREIIKRLQQMCRNRIVPVYLDYPNNKWMRVKPDLFEYILSDEWVLSDNPDQDVKKALVNGFTTFKPQKGDKFVSAGSDWSFDVAGSVAALYKGERVLVTACYDLIPLIYPEFTPGPEFYEQFNKHYTEIAISGAAVFSISENSKKDLLNFWEAKGLAKTAPAVEVIPLAGLDQKNESLPKLKANDLGTLSNIKNSGDYIIFVSTLEPRKNHQMALDLWHELYQARGEQCPTLLIVGMRGWGVDCLIEQMTKMSATKGGKILWLQGVGDELLAHLYANSLYAIFPSFYEGWGLAATEAARFGKVCVVSNNSALEEASYGASPSYHPLDFLGWYKEIENLIDDVDYRHGLEKLVVEKTPIRTWDDYGKDIYEKLLINLV